MHLGLREAVAARDVRVHLPWSGQVLEGDQAVLLRFGDGVRDADVQSLCGFHGAFNAVIYRYLGPANTLIDHSAAPFNHCVCGIAKALLPELQCSCLVFTKHLF